MRSDRIPLCCHQFCPPKPLPTTLPFPSPSPEGQRGSPLACAGLLGDAGLIRVLRVGTLGLLGLQFGVCSPKASEMYLKKQATTRHTCTRQSPSCCASESADFPPYLAPQAVPDRAPTAAHSSSRQSPAWEASVSSSAQLPSDHAVCRLVCPDCAAALPCQRSVVLHAFLLALNPVALHICPRPKE